MTNFDFYVDCESSRLDVYLSEKTAKTRSFIAKNIDDGNVTVNSKVVTKPGHKVLKGDQIKISIPELVELTAKAENIPIDIVYQDDDIVVVNKPQGMVTHPAVGSVDGTLVNALLYNISNLSGINGVIRPGIVHRLDKNTSGLLVVAKNDTAHLSLSKQISEKTALRYYYALVEGNISQDEGVIDKPIARNPKNRKQMAVVENGRKAITIFRTLERFGKYTLVECELRTGRTHQIRVHMKSIGHPVVGDEVYGKKNLLAPNGQLLHAHKLVLSQPTTGERMTFTAPINQTFAIALKKIGFTKKLE